MSTTNLGNQTINWKYKTSLKGSNLAKLNNGVQDPGIYLNNGAIIISGYGIVSSYAGNIIQLNPFEAIFKASSSQTVHIGTTDSINLFDGGFGYITASKPYITMSYAWADQITNYIDFAFKDLSSITTYDIIIGKANFTLGVVSSIDYTNATYPPQYDWSNNTYEVKQDLNVSGSTNIVGDLYVGGNFSSSQGNLNQITMTSSDVTVTNVQAGLAGFLITGTLTANVNLIFPTTYVKSWVIINNCTGNYYITIKESGGTGFTSSPGTSMTIYCDGSSIQLLDTVITDHGFLPTSQCALSGATSSGVPNFAAISSSTNIQIIGATTPLRIAIANGFDEYGEKNILASFNTTFNALTGLNVNGTYYGYYEVISGVGAWGYSSLQPKYQDTFVSSPSTGQACYIISDRKMYVYSGTAWIETPRVYLFRFIVSGNIVTSLAMYVYRGRFEVEQTSLAVGTLYTLPSNFGCVNQIETHYLECLTADAGFSVGDRVYNNNYTGPEGAASYFYGLLVSTNDMNAYITTGASGIGIINKTSGLPNSVFTPARWKAGIILKRPF